jgi:hypothetical protein
MEPPPAPLDDAAIGETKAKGKITQWFNQNPLVGPVTFALGVLSLAATIFFGLTAFKNRELSLYVNPSKTTIVKSGQSSDLHILYKGKDVSTDVTALQIELWNAGKESIRPEHILSPITLETIPRVPILEARLRQISRPVTQTILDTTHIADGRIAVSWKILEHNDGAVIQFILAGPSETSITATGALEGQSRVKVFQVSAIEGFAYPISLLALWCVVAVVTTLYVKLAKRNIPPPKSKLMTVVGPVVAACLVFLAVHYFLGAPSMPLQFN